MLITKETVLCCLAKVAENGTFVLGPQPAPTRGGGVGVLYAGYPGSWQSFDWNEQRTLLSNCIRRGLVALVEASSAGTSYQLTALGIECHAGRAAVPPVPDPDAVAGVGPASGLKAFEEAQRAAGNVAIETGNH